MNAIKLLLTNDWHFAAKNPASRIDSYNDELFELLDQIRLVAVHFKVHAICVSGDLFHDKHPSTRLPMHILVRLFHWAKAIWSDDIELYVIPGNHDEEHDRYESLDRRPLGALLAAGVMRDVSRMVVPLGAGHHLFGVPWPDAEQPDAFQQIPPSATVVMAHGFATPDGGRIYDDFCHKYDDLAVAAPRVRLWHFGHDHRDQNVWTLKNGAKVVNIGALCRGALDNDTILRHVKVAVATLTAGGDVQVQQIALKTRPVEEIFDLKLREQKVKERQQVEAFVSQLKVGLANLTVDYTAALAQLPLEKDVRAAVTDYINKAEQSVS